MKHAYLLILMTIGLTGASLLTQGCGRRADKSATGKSVSSAQATSDIGSTTSSTDALESARISNPCGDLDVIKKRGRLRILAQRFGENYLPRQGYPLDRERELASEFAKTLNLDPALVYVDNFEDLIPALLKGEGDLISANLTVTESRKKLIAFSTAIDKSHEQVVARVIEKPFRSVADLQGHRLAIQEQTSFWERAQKLRKQVPELRIQIASGRLSDDAMLDLVASGRADLTIQDSNAMDVALHYRSDVKSVLTFPEETSMAWGIRPDNPKLLEALNLFMIRRQAQPAQKSAAKTDWDGILSRKTLRMLTRNNAGCYFLWHGELYGFEFECARRFAQSHSLNLEVVVAPSYEELLPMLAAGKGDIVAAFLTPTAERIAQGVAFSKPYLFASEDIVARVSDNKTLTRPEDLAGRTVVVRRSSSYWDTLQKLKARGIAVNIQPASETMEAAELIDAVASGACDLTVADSHILDVELAWRDDIKRAMALTEPKPLCWVARAGDKRLLRFIDDFWEREYKDVFYNVTYNKYFRNIRNIRKYVNDDSRIRLNSAGMISPYDNLVRQYAAHYGFDWCLIVAQMFQESRFDPKATSNVGAKGLLQVMPKTAREMGFHRSLDEPEIGIHAGIKYLDWVRRNIYPEPSPEDQVWFALAAYNAGTGHVSDASRLALQLKLKPNVWFGNVEKAIQLLSQSKYANKARYGYARGGETVRYVSQIRDRYGAYLNLLLDQKKKSH